MNAAAVYRDDFIQTDKKAAARIEAAGSTVDFSAETIAQFEGEEIVLDHGTVSVNTSVGLKVRVGCLTVIPVNGANWTQYVVSDVDGKLTVSAQKSDVYINEKSKKAKEAEEHNRTERAIVHEGEQKSREDKCGAGYLNPSTPPGQGALLNSPWAKLAGAGAVGVVTCWALCRSDDPMSASKP